MYIEQLIYSPEEAVKIYLNKHTVLFAATNYEDAKANVMAYLFAGYEYGKFMQRVFKTPELDKHLKDINPLFINDSKLFLLSNYERREMIFFLHKKQQHFYIQSRTTLKASLFAD